MSYSADNALQIAMQMERLGLTFYKSLAAGCSDSQIVALAVKLADDEKKHLWTFEKMYHSIPLEKCGPKLTEDQLAAAASKYYKLILPTADEVSSVATSGDMAKVLAMAIQMEADAIAYYLSMTSTSKDETAVIRGIAEEEKKHLAVLRDLQKHL